MVEIDTFLPGNANARELAVSEAVAEWWQIPVEILETLWDPIRCPAAVLPHLARALGMPLWLDRWSESEKRVRLARWVALSRRRGAEPTFRALAGFVDADLVRFVAPPQGLFPRSAPSAAERAAYRAQFPEIRVYPHRNSHAGPRRLLVVGQPWFGSRSILRRSRAPLYGGHRATIVDRGVETPVSVRVDVSALDFARGLFTVALPTTAPRLVLPAILGKGTLGNRFVPRASTAARRVYAYGEGADRPDFLPPGTPLSLAPERVAAPHVLRGGFTVGGTLPMAPRASRAAEHVYDSVRIALDGRARPPQPRGGGWVLGRSELRHPPFVLHVTLDLSRRRPGGFMPGHALPMAPRRFDDSRVQEGLAAMRAAKLGRDRVLVGTNLYRPVTAGDRIRAGDGVRAGQIVKSL